MDWGFIRCLFCLLALSVAWGIRARGQEPNGSQSPPPELPLPTQEIAQLNPQASCVQPPPMVRWQDYQGPFNKTVGVFARRLERTSVHPPHYKPGELLCSLTTKGKFLLFVEETVDPVTFLGAAVSAGIDQAEDTDPSFGHGASGYSERFAVELADDASSEFFKEFAYPAIFSEDPRFYRLGHGTNRQRLAHALEHVVIAHQENGKRMFNFSEWLGTMSAVALGDVYHPNNKPGFAPAAQNVGYAFLQDMGFDVLREFWPEVARKFKLPFRDQNEIKNGKAQP